MHYPVLDKGDRLITSSITSLDLHDFSRLARTYGLGGVFAQTNLPQQVALMKKLLSHWIDGGGSEYNPDRCEALGILNFVESFDEMYEKVRDRWGAEPLVTATSARDMGKSLEYGEARQLFAGTERPVIVLFGTAWGLAPQVFERCDWVIKPIGSPSGYNHLSVRSAASIVVDRLFS
jgi:tRNA (guanine37-N1)-methyltransferase